MDEIEANEIKEMCWAAISYLSIKDNDQAIEWIVEIIKKADGRI